MRLRKAVVFDRLLARLVAAAGDRWVLKGALAPDYRLGPGTRTTKDVDLGRRDDEEAATADFLSAQAPISATSSCSQSNELIASMKSARVLPCVTTSTASWLAGVSTP